SVSSQPSTFALRFWRRLSAPRRRHFDDGAAPPVAGAAILDGDTILLRLGVLRSASNDLFDDKQGSVLGLDIEAAQILADDAEDEQLTTPQDQHDGHQRRPTVNRDAGEVAVDRVAEEYHSDYCANETEVHGGAQGND